MSENNQDDKSQTEKRRPSESDVSAPAEPAVSEAPAGGGTPPSATSDTGTKTAAGTAHTARTGSSSTNPAGSAPVAPPPAAPKKAAGRGGLAILWLLVILLMAAVGYLGWQHWLMLSTGDLAARQQALSRLQQSVSATDGELDELRRELETRFMQTEQRATVRDEDVQDRLQEQQAKLNELTSTGRNGWVLSEADYLIRLASHRLLVDRDVVVASTLLQNVDQLLQALDDPQLFRLRQALTSDLSALSLVERVDRTGLYLRIDALQQAVADLPLERHLHERGEALEFASDADTAEHSASTWWQSLTGRVKDAWNHLDAYIRIYRRDQPLQPLLSPDEELYLRLNLRLMLEQAQLALLQQEQGAYEISLNKAQAWLQDYFVNDDRNQTLQDELNELSEHAIVQVLPDLEDSLNAMRQVLRARPQQSNSAESTP